MIFNDTSSETEGEGKRFFRVIGLIDGTLIE